MLCAQALQWSLLDLLANAAESQCQMHPFCLKLFGYRYFNALSALRPFGNGIIYFLLPQYALVLKASLEQQFTNKKLKLLNAILPLFIKR